MKKIERSLSFQKNAVNYFIMFAKRCVEIQNKLEILMSDLD